MLNVCMYLLLNTDDFIFASRSKYMYVSDYVVRDDVCMKGDDFASCGSDGVQQPHLRTAHFHCPTRGIFALHTYIHTFSKCTRK